MAGSILPSNDVRLSLCLPPQCFVVGCDRQNSASLLQLHHLPSRLAPLRQGVEREKEEISQSVNPRKRQAAREYPLEISEAARCSMHLAPSAGQWGERGCRSGVRVAVPAPLRTPVGAARTNREKRPEHVGGTAPDNKNVTLGVRGILPRRTTLRSKV